MLRVMSALMIASALWFAVLTAGLTRNFDFRAFYCGGSAVIQRADPYRTEPLHSCEQKKTDTAYAAFARETVLPAPQPPYVLVFFAAFALLPFALASKLWASLLLLCAAGAIVLISRLAKLPLAVSAATLWLSLCVTSIYLGELIPLFMCALAASAYFAQRERWDAAGICAAMTLAEPHLGVAVCAAMALWAPRSRLAIAIALAVMAAASASALNAAVAIEYVQRVLPLHALSEIGSDAQLSAAVIAHAAGASDTIALRAGSISFIIAVALGICIAPVLAGTYRDRAFIALTPAAFSLIGGVFLHVTDLAAAVPFVLLLLSYAPQLRTLGAAALVLLSVPWFALATPIVLGTLPGCTLSGVVLFYLLFWTTEQKEMSLIIAVAAGLSMFFVVGAFQATIAHAPGIPAPYIPAAYAQASWAAFNAAYTSSSLWPAWFLRGLSWSGLLLMALEACLLALRSLSQFSAGQASAKLRV